LFRQWRIAFEIGVQNRASGAAVTTLKHLVKLLTERWFGKLPKKSKFRSLKPEAVNIQKILRIKE
jgi:hypothetical protein